MLNLTYSRNKSYKYGEIPFSPISWQKSQNLGYKTNNTTSMEGNLVISIKIQIRILLDSEIQSLKMCPIPIPV